MADDTARKYSERNRRYQESMDGICAAGFTEINKGYVPTKARLAKSSGVSRATVNNHFKKTKALLKVCANWPVRRYRKYMESHPAWKKNLMTNQQIFESCLKFMDQNKELFLPICSSHEHYNILRQTVKIIYTKLNLTWYFQGKKISAADPEQEKLYLLLLAFIIREWGKNTRCNFKKAAPYIQQMINITDNITRRDITEKL